MREAETEAARGGLALGFQPSAPTISSAVLATPCAPRRRPAHSAPDPYRGSLGEPETAGRGGGVVAVKTHSARDPGAHLPGAISARTPAGRAPGPRFSRRTCGSTRIAPKPLCFRRRRVCGARGACACFRVRVAGGSDLYDRHGGGGVPGV